MVADWHFDGHDWHCPGFDIEVGEKRLEIGYWSLNRAQTGLMVEGLQVDPLTGKRIVVLGLARQGQALARFAAYVGAEVIVSDLRSAATLAQPIEALSELDIEFVLGEHPMSLLEGTDVLALSGGVPLSAPIVVEAQRRGIQLTNDSQEFIRRTPAEVVGITGSAGKTTTTALTGRMSELGGRRTWVGGNIGRPLIGHLDEMEVEDLAVQELSSFQLEIWHQSPRVAAVLNITPNHLDRHQTMEAYIQAKANILRHQDPGGVAVLSVDDPGARALRPLVRGRLRTFSRREEVADGAFVRDGQIWLRNGVEQRVCSLAEIRLRGEHNVLNVLAAATLADSVGIPLDAIRQAATSFAGVAHRLEVVTTVGEVTYVNDSIATAPERALAAMDAFAEPLILLAGGKDKDLVWDEWVERVSQRVKQVVLFGELAPMLEERLQARRRQVKDDSGPVLVRVNTLDEAVAEAVASACAGDVVLLSPGGTSFDAFRDFEERGEQFRGLVKALTKRRG